MGGHASRAALLPPSLLDPLELPSRCRRVRCGAQPRDELSIDVCWLFETHLEVTSSRRWEMARTAGSVLRECDSILTRPLLTERGFCYLLRSLSIQASAFRMYGALSDRSGASIRRTVRSIG